MTTGALHHQFIGGSPPFSEEGHFSCGIPSQVRAAAQRVETTRPHRTARSGQAGSTPHAMQAPWARHVPKHPMCRFAHPICGNPSKLIGRVVESRRQSCRQATVRPLSASLQAAGHPTAPRCAPATGRLASRQPLADHWPRGRCAFSPARHLAASRVKPGRVDHPAESGLVLRPPAEWGPATGRPPRRVP